jgi:hypothetical protein
VSVRAVGVLVVGVCLLAAGVFSPTGAGGFPDPAHPFAIEPGSFHVTLSSYQAGAHADMTTVFNFEHTDNQPEETYNDLKDAVVNLPPGFIGNATAVPTCTDAQLESIGQGEGCPVDSQIGVISFDVALGARSSRMPARYTLPVYSVQSNTGVAATLGFSTSPIIQILPVSVRPGETALTVTSPSIVESGEPHAVSFTVWGVPSSPVHNAQRGEAFFTVLERGAEPFILSPGGEEVHIPVRPFLANPTRCTSAPLKATMSADSWEEIGKWSEASTAVGPITGCERSPFYPSFEAQPTTTSAESPSGLNATLTVPQTWESPETLASSDLDDTRVTLPLGMTINPSAGSGLGSCTPQQLEKETPFSLPGEGCPPESKIGSIEIETPLIEEKITGAVYIATPYDNPFDSLLALYVVAKNYERGVIVKVAGKIEPNPVTGQLVTTFDEAPQAPFSRFVLKFRPGAVASLVSPPACGSYTPTAELTPWADPLEPRLAPSVPFQISQGVREGPCPSGGVPPFHPQLVSGTENNAAGSYSSFYLRLQREDGEQEITKFTTVLPPGLTGNLTGIPFCPEADIETARHVSGAEEEEHPSCPAASEIGHTIVEAGVGAVLAQTPGRLYLAGPYHGAPLSVVSITSAKVGPFDLGTVVIRFALDINPITAQVEINGATSDPIPHILDGIVVHVRDIHVYLDREHFVENPTSCEPAAVTDTVYGVNPQNLSQITPVEASSRFQAANCQNLTFKPTFKASTSSRWSRTEGTSLTVKLAYPSAPVGTQANIHLVKVELPKRLPSRLPTLQKACTEAVFDANPASCPPASIIGHAKAVTPILPAPLQGPAYFVSHGGAKWPELIMVLQGYGFTIQLHGETLISKQGVTSSTFHAIPDEPVTSFELTLPKGQFSALTGLGNLCKGKLAMPTQFIAQNGMELRQNTKIAVSGCPQKARKAPHKRRGGRARGARRKK